jgi:hypothetical protein
MKNVIIPEGENDGLAQYSEHLGFKEHNVHVLSLWHKDYWREHGQMGNFCENLRIVPEDTQIGYRGHGNIWDDTYKKGQVVCTLMTHAKDSCSIGDKLSRGEQVSLELRAKASAEQNYGLEMSVSDITYVCSAGAELEPKIKE